MVKASVSRDKDSKEKQIKKRVSKDYKRFALEPRKFSSRHDGPTQKVEAKPVAEKQVARKETPKIQQKSASDKKGKQIKTQVTVSEPR